MIRLLEINMMYHPWISVVRRCPLGDGKWMELEFAGGLFGTGLDRLETVISVSYP